jgi:uncharacterized protein YndB with AHSA1/START domain
MLKKILLVLAVVIAAFAVVVALRSPDFRIERSTVIAASPAVVFAQVNDLHKWQEFSPWAKLDPAARYTFEGPPAGQGAALDWAGNRDVGAGRMTIVESRPAELVRFRLEFREPFESVADTEFVFRSAAGGTSVTWSMSGKNNFLARAMCLFMNMDKMVGGDFEKGLANLKAIAEAQARH